MVKKAIGFTVETLTKVKGKRYPKPKFIDGGLTKEKALQMAMKLANSTTSVEIDREYEITDRYGDIETEQYIYAIVKRVKRKSGYAFVIDTYDKYGDLAYAYDLKADGRMTNRR